MIDSLAAVLAAWLALGPPAPRAAIAPPEWIRGEWQNAPSADADRQETIVFLENDIRFSTASADKPVSADARFASCALRESADARMYRLETGPECGSYVYEFRLVRGACGTGAAGQALVYTITHADAVIQPPAASCSLLLFKLPQS